MLTNGRRGRLISAAVKVNSSQRLSDYAKAHKMTEEDAALQLIKQGIVRAEQACSKNLSVTMLKTDKRYH